VLEACVTSVVAVIEYRMAQSAETPAPVFRRGDYMLATDPLALWWNGSEIALSPLELGLMHLLMVRGKVAWATVEERLRISTDTRCTIVHRLRRKLEAAGVHDPLLTVRNWGVRLRVAPEELRHVWIGADERNHYLLAERIHTHVI
jgi:DNA-binding response OmpR family regulator